MASDKVIIVTGASRGIGLAICNLLMKPLSRCNVIAVARSQKALAQLEEEGDGRVVALAGDLASDMQSPTSVAQQALKMAKEKWGRLDGVVINHGRLEPVDKLVDVNLSEWQSSINTNVVSAVALIQAAIPMLRETKGKVICTSSGASLSATSAWSCYCASKAVINSLVRSIAEEEPEITALAIRPGVVDTEMIVQMAEQHYPKMADKNVERFKGLRQDGKLLKPHQPGNVMARLAMTADKSLSGKYLDWNAPELEEYQDL